MSVYNKIRDMAEWGENEFDRVSAMQDFILDRELDDESKQILINLTEIKEMLKNFNADCTKGLRSF
jgi:hypothetical protein